MKVAIYARISTNGKKDNGEAKQTPQTQLLPLREYCQQRGWEIAGEYIDEGVSGAKDNRPALNRLMADAKRRRFGAVLVWKMDRFGRSLRHLVNSLAEFEALGIAFVSMTESLDMTTPQGKLMFGIVSCMAEFERSLIQERVKSGMRRAKAQGKAIGRPSFDFDRDYVLGRVKAGESQRQIAKSLGVSPAFINKRIKAS